MATKTLSAADTKSITSQIANIQAGINKLKAGSSSGSSASSYTPQQVAQINASREANVKAGKSAYSGSGATELSTSLGLGKEVPQELPEEVEAEPVKKLPGVQAANQMTQPTVQSQAVPMDQAVKNLQTNSGLKGAELESATSSLKDWYTRAHGLSQQAGVAPDQGMGGGAVGAQQFLTETASSPETPSLLGDIMGTDGNFDSILTSLDEFMSPMNQRTSLLEEYKKLSSSLGIEGMNEELIDAKRIIEGTEDDIRAEVTSVGGFATDSQVQALANARNKSLIKNYNYLLESRDNAMQQLDTMMDLTIADRDAAQKEFDTKLNFAFKVAEFKERATNNARDTYLTLGEKMGWDTVIASASPYEQSLIQKTLGISGSALQSLSLQSRDARALQTRKDEADIANTYSQINERNDVANSYGTIDNKPQTQNQSTANSYANRLNEADVVIANLGSKFTGAFSMLPNFNRFKTGDRQAYEQAQNNFITAVLRRESGASIAPTEFDTARKTYFPQPGDKPETVLQKETARNTVINNFYREANVNRPVLPGQVIKSDGKKYRVGMDGETLEKI